MKFGLDTLLHQTADLYAGPDMFLHMLRRTLPSIAEEHMDAATIVMDPTAIARSMFGSAALSGKVM
eukprot:CAMPEP_0181484654 /NCGR_PEP_ID=MMETSP1110-20121109/46119_1 /TAXON_ID=174948 /ORGANISM="Symbiodinium sp., Strain CCMP421" /LENGTH=65 /DNA_ID=CAMNT_0023610545 /DNA_START=634 /DNA_END=832 /DNA_ORIENTATION=+